MQPLRLALLFALVNVVAPSAGPLRVMRVFPTENADPLTEIVVTFDRPVAGGLDSTVPADRVFRITPAIAGKLEWRDPVTIRFRPDAPLTPGAEYTVTIANQFAAMDGSQLEEPFTHTFRVAPALIITGDPVGPRQTARFLPQRPTFRLLISASADPRRIAAATSIALSPQCGNARVGLNLVQMRRISEDDAGVLRWSGRSYAAGDSLRDLRRVIELTPATPLPLGCSGSLVVPAELSEDRNAVSWPFQTYGRLQVLHSQCAYSPICPTGPIEVAFSTPVRGSEVMRHIRVLPGIPFTVRDTTEERDVWILDLKLEPRRPYSVLVDPQIVDVFGQRLGTQSAKGFITTSYSSIVSHQTGRMLVERQGLRTLAVEVVNVDSVQVTSIAIPESAEADFLSRTWNWEEPFQALKERATNRTIPVTKVLDKPFILGVPFAPNDARVTRNGTLVAVQIKRAGGPVKPEELSGIALIQVTDLAVHGRIGIDDGWVWVTGVRDGQPRANANVTLYDKTGKVRATARSNAQGLARLTSFRPAEEACEGWCGSFEGYVAATLNEDRAVVGLTTDDPDLAPWRFDVWSAWSEEMRIPAAAAVFTERGIYRPGEKVYAKAIVRRGPLGALVIPARNDSVKWTFTDRETGVLKDTIAPLSTFGTAHQTLQLANELPLGQYNVKVSLKHQGAWKEMGNTQYQVAEYRPPEFLVEVNADQTPRYAGDSLSAQVSARYLFGAPMANSPVRWVVQQRTLFSWDLNIPNTEGWEIGGYSDFDEYYEDSNPQVAAEGVDTLDAKGATTLKVALPAPRDGRGARAGIIAVVTDANRQSVAAGRSVIVHPAAFYIAAKDHGADYFWRGGAPVTIDVMTVRPTGERVAGVAVTGNIVRREWHNARRIRGGQMEEVGGWVTDTVATCRVQTAAAPAGCQFTPKDGGFYQISLTATDPQRREARTTMYRWASGPGSVPWRDDNKLKIDVIPDKKRYNVGDTATLMVASPFTNVEAWLTVERERVLESRRLRITAGATTVKVPITEALAPNAFVSILLVRGRSAPPGPLDDPGRPTMRVGYAALKVEPAVKRLTIDVKALQAEYRPGDTARVQVNVKDVRGAGQRSEVTLWAVDEGVLALTGYQTPDPLDLLYQERGLGIRLASNLTSVAPQVPAGQKGRAPGGGGGADISAILRSRFQTTAFFLGSVQTDANGNVTVAAKLPDNLTTFRVMAVAVTSNDRYGWGQAPLLVSRPLVARAALPRFVREGDKFTAGVLVNQRMGGTQRVEVEATARGIVLEGSRNKTETLNGAAAREVRFAFQAQPGDTARFQFAARAGNEADAVAVNIPVRPNYYPLAQTIAGVLRDTASAEFALDPQVDPARSTLELSFGSSAYAVIRGVRRSLRVYPYYCTEQVSSMALPLIALAVAQRQLGNAPPNDQAARDIETAVRTISRRQRPDGGIGYWSPSDWTSPWLTAYAGRVLLEARNAGFAVDTLVLSRIGEFVTRTLREPDMARYAISYWYSDSRMQLSDRVAGVDLLSRLGRPDAALENSLLSQAAQLRWEDRVLLAEVLARRGQMTPAQSLLASAWQSARLEGRRVTLPADDRPHYFPSTARPAARLLTATLAIDPANASIGPLVETLVTQGKVAAASFWNTQDYGFTVLALMAYERANPQQQQGTVTIRGNDAVLARNLAAGPARDTTVTLNKMVDRSGRLRLNLSAQGSSPLFYYLTVREVPKVRPVTPVDRGIQVERWYERVDSRTPIVSVAAGDVVRVRVRITIPSERTFVVINDPLPAGLEAVDLSLRTVSPFSSWEENFSLPEERDQQQQESSWYFGAWDAGMWSPFDHKELYDDRVVYSATVLWKGRYTATYLARATTAGTFIVPPAHAEEMYNPAVNGRTGGSTFTVR